MSNLKSKDKLRTANDPYYNLELVNIFIFYLFKHIFNFRHRKLHIKSICTPFTQIHLL